MKYDKKPGFVQRSVARKTRLARVLHPAWYHGHDKRPPFFEGWYFKLVDATGQHRYAIIPGIFKSDDPAKQHAFVQVLNGTTGQATYHRFPAARDLSSRAAFRAAHDRFEVTIGANRFTQDLIALQLAGPDASSPDEASGSPDEASGSPDEASGKGQTIYGEVHFEGLVPWPVTLLSPGIMGPFGWLPNLQCYHGVLGLDHGLRGKLVVDGLVIDWEGGRGYIEKDWGAAFPAAWIWMQTNHFEQPGTSLTASVALIPWHGLSFRGQIVGLWHEGQLYRFATYTGARIERLEVGRERVTWVLRGRTPVGGPLYRLEIDAQRPGDVRHTPDAPGVVEEPILGPSVQGMGVRVDESLSALVRVRLVRLRPGASSPDEASGSPDEASGEVVFEGLGRYAGLEVGGEIERLLGA